MPDVKFALACILAAAVCTFLMRALPFLVLGGKKEIPEKVRFLGKVLPSTIMAVLIVYCMRNLSTEITGNGWHMIVASVVCVGLHLWKRNTLLSVFVSTAVYVGMNMLL